MSGSRSHLAVALALLIVSSTVGLAAAAGSIDSSSDTLAIDDNHGLDSDRAISKYNSEGRASTDLDQIDGSLTVTEEKSEIGVEGQMVPLDVRNNYVRIDYREDFSRTLRIHIPRGYQMPYSQSGVESVTSDHQAELRPVRGAEYLEIVVHVDEPDEIVIPLQKDSSMSYRSIEFIDGRLEAATGSSVFGSGDEWRYLDNEELATNAAYELEGDPDDIVVQYDTEKASPSETWLNAPQGESNDVGVYWFVRESNGNQTAYVVATQDDAPNVRYKSEGGEKDRILGDVRDALKNFDRIQDLINSNREGENSNSSTNETGNKSS